MHIHHRIQMSLNRAGNERHYTALCAEVKLSCFGSKAIARDSSGILYFHLQRSVISLSCVPFRGDLHVWLWSVFGECLMFAHNKV